MSWLEALRGDPRRVQTWPAADRRATRRSMLGMTFRIWVDGLSLQPMTGHTRNLSRNGMYFISLPGNYRRGLRVSIELNEKNRRNGHWRMPGKIARVAKLPNYLYGIGVEFLHKFKP